MVKIFISSNKKYEAVHLHRLINNIKTTDIPLENVYIIIGGYDSLTESYENLDGVHIYRVRYNSFDYTSLIFIGLNRDTLDFDFCFNSHDTVLFGQNFYSKINSVIQECNKNDCNVFPIMTSRLPSFSIGLYKKDAILSHLDKDGPIMKSLYNEKNDTETLFKYKWHAVFFEDYIFNHNKKYIMDIEPQLEEIVKTTMNNEIINIRILTFHHLDFKKFQTNTGTVKSIHTFIDFPSDYNIN